MPGPKGKGRGRKTWQQCVDRDMLDLGLKAEWAQDRQEWEAHLAGTG